MNTSKQEAIAMYQNLSTEQQDRVNEEMRALHKVSNEYETNITLDIVLGIISAIIGTFLALVTSGKL